MSIDIILEGANTTAELRAHVPQQHSAQVRVLDQADVAALQQFWATLDRDGCCARFGHGISRKTLASYGAGAVADTSLSFGAFHNGSLRGLLQAYPHNRDAAELALVVAPEARGQGLGSSLLEHALRWAADHGLAKVLLTFSRQNWRMRHLVSKANARLDLFLDDFLAEIDVRAPPHIASQ